MAAQPIQYPTLVWRKSRASAGNGACVEVAFAQRSVLVRDSRGQSGHMADIDGARRKRHIGIAVDSSAHRCRPVGQFQGIYVHHYFQGGL